MTVSTIDGKYEQYGTHSNRLTYRHTYHYNYLYYDTGFWRIGAMIGDINMDTARSMDSSACPDEIAQSFYGVSISGAVIDLHCIVNEPGTINNVT